MMKRQIFLSALTLVLLVGVTSCRKNDRERSDKSITVNGVVAINGQYTYTLAPNTQGAWLIKEAASHASSSQIVRNSAGAMEYQYTPAKDYAGIDKVMLAEEGSGNGKCRHDEGSTVMINLSITESGK